jgi:hypothetical protein
VLNDGRRITTLANARGLILSLPELHQKIAHWRYAAELLSKAADHGGKYNLFEARAQLVCALKVEVWIAPERNSG